MVKHPWPLLEISLSDFRWLATLNINTYLAAIFSKSCLLKNLTFEIQVTVIETVLTLFMVAEEPLIQNYLPAFKIKNSFRNFL